MCIISKHTLCYWSSANRGLGPVREHHLNCPDVKVCFQDWKCWVWTCARTGQNQQCLLWSADKAQSCSAKHTRASPMHEWTSPELSRAFLCKSQLLCIVSNNDSRIRFNKMKMSFFFFFPASMFSDLAFSGLLSLWLILPFAFFWKIELMW